MHVTHSYVQINGQINSAYMFQAKTRLALLQAALVHIVLYKRKVIVDHLRKGLELLRFLKEISRYPKFYKHFFLGIDCFSVAEVTAKESGRPIYQKLHRIFISSSSSERLKEVLEYSTGRYQGAYIKYAEGGREAGTEGLTIFFKKNFVAQNSIDPNIS